MRTKIYAGNWKMHYGPAETAAFFAELGEWLKGDKKTAAALNDAEIEVLIYPTAVCLESAARAIGLQNGQKLPFTIGAQNVHWESKGAFTGEISVSMAKEVGCSYVLVGHSERRHLFGETNEQTHKKIESVLAADMIAMLCVGELLEEREAGRTFAVIDAQLAEGLGNLVSQPDLADRIVIAYEPVWAIGTGKTASDLDAQQVCAHIREWIASRNAPAAKRLRILYGGSVKPENSAAIMAQPDIDGLLVGGASLAPSQFERILTAS